MTLLWLLAACQAGIVVEGNAKYIKEPDFSKKINEAIGLLKSKAPAAHTLLMTHVGRVRAHAHSGTNVYETPITIDIAKPTFDASLTWLASVLAHESIHAKQYVEKRAYTGQQAELEGNAHQIEVLRRIGAPQREIAYLLSLDGNHFDVNKDGVYDEKDYQNRNW